MHMSYIGPINAFGDLSGPGMGAHGRTIAAGWTAPALPAVVEALVNEDMRHRSRCGAPDCDHIWSARLAASSANRCDDLGWWTLTRRPNDFARGAGGLLVAVCRDDAARRCWPAWRTWRPTATRTSTRPPWSACATQSASKWTRCRRDIPTRVRGPRSAPTGG